MFPEQYNQFITPTIMQINSGISIMHSSKTISILFFLCIFLAGCKGSENGNDLSPEQAANRLVERIDLEINNGNYREALTLIDSLNTAYPKQIDARRTTLLSRARAMEGIIRDSIPIVDRMIVSSRIMCDSLKSFFVPVSSPGFPAYLVDKKVSGVSVTGGNAVQPRIESGSVESWNIIVSLAGRGGITDLYLDIDGHNVPLTPDGLKVSPLQGDGYEAISLDATVANRLGEALLHNPDATKAKLNVVRSGGSIITLPLGENTLNAIRRTYLYANALATNRRALIERELLDRKLTVAQNQVANYQ